MPLTPHFAVPFTVSGGAPLEVEQDTAQEISQCVEVVLQTIEGTWIDEPEFGIPDETFTQLAPNPDAALYLSAIDRWEPRSSAIGTATVEGAIERIVIEEGN
jgi:phage baseplate assembly protein W